MLRPWSPSRTPDPTPSSFYNFITPKGVVCLHPLFVCLQAIRYSIALAYVCLRPLFVCLQAIRCAGMCACAHDLRACRRFVAQASIASNAVWNASAFATSKGGRHPSVVSCGENDRVALRARAKNKEDRGS